MKFIIILLCLFGVIHQGKAGNSSCDPFTVSKVRNVTISRTNSASPMFGGETYRLNYSFYWLQTLSQQNLNDFHVSADSSDSSVVQVLDTRRKLTGRLRNFTEALFSSNNRTFRASYRDNNGTSVLISPLLIDGCMYELFEDYITIQGDFLGKCNLTLIITTEVNGSRVTNQTNDTYSTTTQIVVLRKIRAVEIAFRVIIIIFILIITFSMGAALEPRIILSYVKRPIAPAIGFGCQYLLMPLIAFGIAMLVPMDKAFGFGLVTTGCSPGGGGSNVWTILLKGDLNLSMVMTFLSSLAAMGMMPLWLFLLKGFFLESSVRVPFEDIARDLLSILVPVLCGMFLRWKFPKAADRVCRATRPMALLFILYVLTFGVYVNWYIFRMFYRMPYLIAIGGMLPWLGFAFGGLTAFFLRQSRPQIVAIALETGIQNVGIPIVILMYSLPQPEGSIGAAMPLAVALFTPLPLYLLLAGLKLYQCFFKKPKPKKKKKSKLEDEPSEVSEGGDDDDDDNDNEDNDGNEEEEERHSLAKSDRSSHHDNISLRDMD